MSNPIKYATAVLALIGATGGAVAAISKTEPAWFALHYWVRDHVEERLAETRLAEEHTMKILRDLQIETAEGKRDATTNDLAKWTVEYNKAQDQGIKDLAQKQINSLDAAKRRLDNQIETLNRLRGAADGP